MDLGNARRAQSIPKKFYCTYGRCHFIVFWYIFPVESNNAFRVFIPNF